MGGRKEDGVKYGKFSRGSSRVVIVCIAEEKNFTDMSKKLKDKLRDPVLQLRPWDHATYPSNFLTYLYVTRVGTPPLSRGTTDCDCPFVHHLLPPSRPSHPSRLRHSRRKFTFRTSERGRVKEREEGGRVPFVPPFLTPGSHSCVWPDKKKNATRERETTISVKGSRK